MIFYSERSGSNLLRVLLGNHSEITAPVPAHLLDAFRDDVPAFGNLAERDNMVSLLAGMIRYVNHPFSDWQLNANAETLFDRFRPRTFVEAFDAVHRAKLQADGSRHYVCKDNHLFDYAFPLLHRLDNLKFVYLYRDPRDVVSSWMKHRMRFFTPFDAARSWKEEQAKCIELERVFGIEMHHVSYENLVQAPEEVMTGVLEFLGLEVEEACFVNRGEKPEAGRNILWKNLDKPIMKDNTRNFPEVLSDKAINLVESVAAPEMQYLGYEPVTDADWHIRSRTLFGIVNTIRRRIRKRLLGKKDPKSAELIRDRIELKRRIVKEARKNN